LCLTSHAPHISWPSTLLLAPVYHAPGREAGPQPDGEAGVAGRWLGVNSTAEELGISTDAVPKRIARGSLESDRRDGHVLVWLDDGGTEAKHETQGEAPADGGALVEVLTDQVSYLREQLSEEREDRRRADTIIAHLTEINTQLSNRVLELDAPAQSTEASEPSEEAAQDAANGLPGPAPRPAVGSLRTALGAPCWRRVFGG
jgi:hypothetical protein